MLDEERLSDSDLARVAALHIESIDDSLPALLGSGFAKRMYRYLEASDSELVLVERVSGRIESVCVVSFEPHDLQPRIVRATLVALAWGAAFAIFTRPEFRRLLWNVARDAVSGSDVEAKAPEITYVFTNAQLRGQRLGRKLVERVDAALREREIDGYFVKTLDDPSNRALRFYAENGFERVGSRTEGGRRFVEFHKDLAAG